MRTLVLHSGSPCQPPGFLYISSDLLLAHGPGKREVTALTPMGLSQWFLMPHEAGIEVFGCFV